VDFAHNEAGTDAILDVAGALAGGPARVTAIVGTAGDRPDDTLRGIGRIAAVKAGRVVIKETIAYLRGRDREEIVRIIGEGLAEGGVDPADVSVHGTEAGALEAELARGGADAPGVVVLFCHQDRDEVFALLERLGAHGLDAATELRDVVRSAARGRRPAG
jgi:cyanophycin synthetase